MQIYNSQNVQLLITYKHKTAQGVLLHFDLDNNVDINGAETGGATDANVNFQKSFKIIFCT